MKFLVTGGLGFLGRPICESLAAAGHDVLALDSRWRTHDLPALAGGQVVQADVRDAEAVSAAAKDANVVIHLAAIQGTRNFYEQPELVLDVNLRGTLNVVDACSDAGVRRLLFSSSSEVYGVPKVFPTPETEPLVVPDPLNPRWSYGASKIAGELIVANAARRHGFDFTILRYHNVYGPAMGWDHVIPQLICRLERGEEFIVQGDGTQSRSFCFVDDAVEVTVLAALDERAAGQILNVGNPREERTIAELVDLLGRVSGRSLEPRYVKLEGEGTQRRLPDVSRIRQLLGWQARTSLEEGLQRTYDWYEVALRAQQVASQE